MQAHLFASDRFVPTKPRPRRKRVQLISRETFALLEATGTLTKRRRAVFEAVTAYRAERRHWPTCSEIVAWMFDRHELARPSSNLISGRLTELRDAGVVEFLPVRVCKVTSGMAHPIRVVVCGESNGISAESEAKTR